MHPLIRAAVYEALTPAERDSGHARAARLLEAAGAEPERVAAQLLLAPRSGDPGVVALLREAARRAGSRGAAESAVDYLRRALAEPPPAAERAELLLELGSAEALVSGDAAVEHLQEAHGLLDDPIRRAETALLLGHQLLLLFSRGDESDAVLTQAQDELGGIDAELERLLEAALIMNALSEASLYPKAVERLERLRGRLGDTTVGEKTLLAALTYHDALAGAPAGLVVPFARRALAEGTLIREAPAATFVLAASVLAWADLDEAVVAYDDALAQAHRRGSIHTFAVAKIFRAQAFVWRGELAEAEADCREAFAATETWGTSWLLAALLAPFLADALMEQGKLEEAAAALARVESFPDTSQFFLLSESRARLRLLRGDLAGGVEELFVAGRHFQAVGGNNPAFLAWRSQAALALLQLGEQDEARRLAAEELELARTWGAPRALGAALRAAGLIEGGKEGLAQLEEAVEVLADSPAKLEHAKARSELGAALRRANRRTEAREQLRRGLELATLCGAVPLAARAETELLATGARPRRISLTGVESLTPSERRVAQLAAEGPTNREIAQALFVTPRTVEVHLDEQLPQARDQLPLAADGGARRTVRCLTSRPRSSGRQTDTGTGICTSWVWVTCRFLTGPPRVRPGDVADPFGVTLGEPTMRSRPLTGSIEQQESVTSRSQGGDHGIRWPNGGLGGQGGDRHGRCGRACITTRATGIERPMENAQHRRQFVGRCARARNGLFRPLGRRSRPGRLLSRGRVCHPSNL